MTQQASRGQVRQLITLAGKAGLKDRTERLEAVGRWVGRPIRSTNDLTSEEAEYAIGEVKVLLETDDGLPTPPSAPGWL
jgi:hypothetical protein